MDKQNIETIYALAPLQQAFLWHSLQRSAQDGLIHMRSTLRGSADATLLQQAWDFVVAQHPGLRTSVHWEGVKQPLQVVAKRAVIPWTHLDWRDRDDQQTALANFLDEDRGHGFELTQTPISRLALIRLGETAYELVWSCHHLMLDGWSGALVFNQVFDCYEALRRGEGPVVKAMPTYQSFVRWLKQQDEKAAAVFWQETLKGVVEPMGLPVFDSAYAKKGIKNAEDRVSPVLRFSPEVTAELREILRSHRLTLNTLMQGIWALLLHSYSGRSDVLFGATVSGRQGDLAGVESIVGMLINVLPIRVKIVAKKMILNWLRDLQTQQATAGRYAYASPDQIQSWSGVSGHLFDSLLVIENYPIQATSDRSLQVENMQSGLVSTYGLTVVVKPGNELTIMLQAQEPYREVLTTLLDQFQTVVEAIVENPERSVEEILPVQTLLVEEQSVESGSDITANLSREQLEGHFFAPSNLLELKLTKIWESVLGVSPLSVEDNFFDVGGDSLLAVQLFNQMQQQLDCALPLATLFQAPNVRQFAALLSQEQPISTWSSLVPIQTSGSRTPLFFHGGSADALTWARFSHSLGSERPFYALQRPDLDGSEVTHTTVEELATDCIKEMRMVQPKGPYLVGGHCLGGAIAFEIAQQLQADDEDLVSVILIDSYIPGKLPETALTTLQSRLQLGVFWLRKNYYYHGGWENLAGLPEKIWQKFMPTKAFPDNVGSVKSETIHTDSSNTNPTQSEETKETKVPYEYRYARAQKANELAADLYVPQPYAGQVKLFCADIQILDWYFGRELGWQTVAKDGVEMTKIPGFFGNLFNQRSTPLLVEQVKTYLAGLQ
ncbi:MAG: alpha/beta fold hydrolase [Leptolyngbya sp. SIO3F4]|nr:alpha/beta fold hydrolase [Leptolyngbya sp. SIO3F4]